MNARSIVLVAVVSATIGGVARAQDKKPSEAAVKAIEASKTALRDELAKNESFQRLPIKTDTLVGPCGTTIVRARAEGAYPGSGILAVLVDDKDGTTYGRHGAKDLADLVRARGFLEKPPAAADLVRLADVAFFEAVVMHDDRARKPTAEKTETGLVLKFVRAFMPSGACELVTVTFPAKGNATVSAAKFEKK